MTFRNQAWRAFGSTCWTGYQVVLLQALKACQSARAAWRRQALLISWLRFEPRLFVHALWTYSVYMIIWYNMIHADTIWYIMIQYIFIFLHIYNYIVFLNALIRMTLETSPSCPPFSNSKFGFWLHRRFWRRWTCFGNLDIARQGHLLPRTK